MRPEHELAFFEGEGCRWIQKERLTRLPSARALTPVEHAAMAGFFNPELLAKAWIQRVPIVPNPDFYQALIAAGQPIPLDFSARMEALTLVDCILIADSKIGVGPIPPGLLFHELVHVVQYDVLGVEEFMHRYVRGWAGNGENYDRIPIEVQAYHLQGRYEAAADHRFSVEQFVRAQPPK